MEVLYSGTSSVRASMRPRAYFHFAMLFSAKINRLKNNKFVSTFLGSTISSALSNNNNNNNDWCDSLDNASALSTDSSYSCMAGDGNNKDSL